MFNTKRSSINNDTKTIAVSFRCNKEEQDFLDEKSNKFKRKKSDLIREAIMYYVEHLESRSK
jgi:predicted DNA-binding protein